MVSRMELWIEERGLEGDRVKIVLSLGDEPSWLSSSWSPLMKSKQLNIFEFRALVVE